LEGKSHRTVVEEVNSFKRRRQDFWNVELIVSRLLGAGNIIIKILVQKVMQDTQGQSFLEGQEMIGIL